MPDNNNIPHVPTFINKVMVQHIIAQRYLENAVNAVKEYHDLVSQTKYEVAGLSTVLAQLEQSTQLLNKTWEKFETK